MTCRERVLKAMRREGPDRVPCDIGFTPPALKKFKERAGTEDYLEFFKVDVRSVGPSEPEKPDYSRYYKNKKLPEGTDVSLYGVAYVPGNFYHFTHVESPLAGQPAETVYDYPLPDYSLAQCYEGLDKQVKELHDQGFAVCGWWGHIFETAWAIRGMEDFLADLIMNPEAMIHLVNRLHAFRTLAARKLAEAGVDVFVLGDDVATQKGMMMSPEIWRKVFKSAFAEAVRAAKSAKPDILTWYHSDGNCLAIVPDLIECGLDILNPVQPECMNLAQLNRDFGKHLSFWGTIGTQSTMPFGTPADVRRAVRKAREDCGSRGGVLIAPTHVIEPDVPFENLLALRDAIHGPEGRYA